ncbi:synaptic vesicle glycoprotein 2B-like [Epargyreus clarus]|uniref:synaptic vesicle glycoprotein 2B-like n=1 Tax=Epargyreus clarus TaxID=520877 RepID=UPI003C2C4FCA
MVANILFEDALDMTGFGKFNYLSLLLNVSLIMGMAFEIFSVAYLVPASACELLTTNSQQGMMAGMPLFGIIATSHFWGYLADTRGRKRVLSWSLTLGFVTGASATFSPNWIVFSILKFMSSSAVAGTFALSLTLLGECTPSRRRSTMIALTTSIFLASTGLMAILTIPILPLSFSYYIPYLNIHFNSWRLLNAMFAVPCAVGAVGIMFAYESPKYLLSVGDEAQALDVLRGIFVINSGKSGDEYQVTALTLDEANAVHVKGLWASMVSQTMPLLKPPLLKNTVLLSILFIIVYFCINPYTVWLPYVTDGFMRSLESGDKDFTFCQMLRSSQNVTMSETSDCSLNQFAMVTVFAVNVSLSALNTVLSTLINCFGRKRLLIAVQLFAGTAGLLVNLSSNWQISGPLFIAYVAGVLNFGFLSTFSVEIFPTYVKAMAVCLTLMLGRGSSVLGINLLKSMLVNNCEASFYIFGGLTFAGGLIAFLLPADAEISKDKAQSIKK